MKYNVSQRLVSMGIGLLLGFTISLGVAVYFFIESEDLRNRCGLSALYNVLIHFAHLDDN